MWDILDFRDYALVKVAERELWREAAERALQRQARQDARKVRQPRLSKLGALAARLRPHHDAGLTAA